MKVVDQRARAVVEAAKTAATALIEHGSAVADKSAAPRWFYALPPISRCILYGTWLSLGGKSLLCSTVVLLDECTIAVEWIFPKRDPGIDGFYYSLRECVTAYVPRLEGASGRAGDSFEAFLDKNREAGMRLGKASSVKENRKELLSIIAHELAHAIQERDGLGITEVEASAMERIYDANTKNALLNDLWYPFYNLLRAEIGAHLAELPVLSPKDNPLNALRKFIDKRWIGVGKLIGEGRFYKDFLVEYICVCVIPLTPMYSTFLDDPGYCSLMEEIKSLKDELDWIKDTLFRMYLKYDKVPLGKRAPERRRFLKAWESVDKSPLQRRSRRAFVALLRELLEKLRQ